MNRENITNQKFLDAVMAGGENLQKLASATSFFIKDGVREKSFLDEIIPLITVQKEDLDRRVEDDFPMVLCEIEQGAEAKRINFRGKPDDKYFTGLKYPVLFDKIVSPFIRKSEAELMTIRHPITQVIEDRIIKDMARVRDEAFIDTCDAMVADTGLAANFAGNFGRAAIAAGLDLLEGQGNQPCGCILMSKTAWNNYNASAAIEEGNDVVTEMVRTGYQSKTIMGYKVIVTQKPFYMTGTKSGGGPNANYIYFFSPPDYLGHNFVLQEPTFQVKKEMDIIEMVCWGFYGAGIGNKRGVARIRLT